MQPQCGYDLPRSPKVTRDSAGQQFIQTDAASRRGLIQALGAASCGKVSTLSYDEEVSVSTKKHTQKCAKSVTPVNRKSKGFTDEERAAMKERARELRAEARRGGDKADGEGAVLAKISEMPEPDRAMAKR